MADLAAAIADLTDAITAAISRLAAQPDLDHAAAQVEEQAARLADIAPAPPEVPASETEAPPAA